MHFINLRPITSISRKLNKRKQGEENKYKQFDAILDVRTWTKINNAKNKHKYAKTIPKKWILAKFLLNGKYQVVECLWWKLGMALLVESAVFAKNNFKLKIKDQDHQNFRIGYESKHYLNQIWWSLITLCWDRQPLR